MENPYTDFVGKVWEQFPQLAQLHNLENTTLPMCNLDQFVESTYHNFIAKRKPLYYLSKLIENYAQENYRPLLASFETIARFKFVERRYSKIIHQIPKIWIIGAFEKTHFYLPSKIDVFNCRNTEMANIWSVITRGPNGPFGLISEEFEDGKFRGFFTTNPDVCRCALKIMGKTLGTKFDI
ncbi:hypothetical protein [Nitrosopumilus sp. b2]|uniref:hypothetical protein n=1 Tax=Nitrosopumilus sp. b2 TaxID=2109908 RepID=UPI0015F6128E|nr:hypothetical protein [Nitrosopumilus sp. b2]KAF6245112.1 hypothetical protein C6989_05345 [Nitrosopumilus sp. b2]